MQLEAELRDLEAQSAELQVEGESAITEYKVKTRQWWLLQRGGFAVPPCNRALLGPHAISSRKAATAAGGFLGCCLVVAGVVTCDTGQPMMAV